ncbi:GNAT family N-acetyltransferase [Arthrobacter sp. R1-13]
MAEIEGIAARGGASRVILQTGDQQPGAVALYSKLGYTESAL